MLQNPFLQALAVVVWFLPRVGALWEGGSHPCDLELCGQDIGRHPDLLAGLLPAYEDVDGAGFYEPLVCVDGHDTRDDLELEGHALPGGQLLSGEVNELPDWHLGADVLPADVDLNYLDGRIAPKM